MSYTMIGDLKWDTLPGGALVSTVTLLDENDTAEHPQLPGDPIQGPCTVEYMLVDGKISFNLSGANTDRDPKW